MAKTKTEMTIGEMGLFYNKLNVTDSSKQFSLSWQWVPVISGSHSPDKTINWVRRGGGFVFIFGAIISDDDPTKVLLYRYPSLGIIFDFRSNHPSSQSYWKYRELECLARSFRWFMFYSGTARLSQSLQIVCWETFGRVCEELVMDSLNSFSSWLLCLKHVREQPA